MYRVLVTDSGGKQTLALARYVRRALPDVRLIGWEASALPFSRFYSCYHERLYGGTLADAAARSNCDMVVAVGGSSVLQAIESCPQLSILPTAEQAALCYDKLRSAELAESVGVPAPRSVVVQSADDPRILEAPSPCVVKARTEGPHKRVFYAATPDEVRAAVAELLSMVGAEAGGVLVQERIVGPGCGFFALCREGEPLRVFMHERIREYPPTGGPSTAARAIYDERLKDYGLRILRALRWSGVAMVEFKRSEAAGDYVLMEINGKFWGSLELALRSGVNFGADLIRLYRGEDIGYSEAYNRECHFYWPLDDDLLNLWQTRRLGQVKSYFGRDHHTNLWQAPVVDVLKCGRLLKHLVRRGR